MVTGPGGGSGDNQSFRSKMLSLPVLLPNTRDSACSPVLIGRRGHAVSA